ncbi:MAG: TolC family protein [Bacteroidetes bacterium]|jgi:outer membrane protein, heavy metal efflux system|nr:TolC family protein [Bacteroidota bacterium]MDA0880151.1 TolC family protein [Bacteroidota bacterium]MDA1116268.1 TolC family protein [Bacteroidota bacterium]
MNRYSLSILALLVISLTQGQDLQSYILEAEANNLELQALGYKNDIALEKVNEVNSLPNTELGFGFFVHETETRTGAQKLRFSVRQMMPWFGTITARQNYASTLANVEYENLVLAQRKLRLAVAQSYYILFAIQAKKDVLDDNIKLINTYETIALNAVSVGKASLVDVLKLQMRQNELNRQKELLNQASRKEETAFNHLLNRDSEMNVSLVSDLTLPELDVLNDDNAIELHPELVKYDKLFASVTGAELVNKKESSPNLGLGIEYVSVEARSGLEIEDNGKDMLMPMLSLSIPIFSHKYKSQTVQNNLKQQALLSEKNNRRNQLVDILVAAQSERESARISYQTFSLNIEKAIYSLDLLLKNYEVQSKDFKDLLETQELLLNLEVAKIDALKNYYSQSAIINYLSNQ